MKHDTSKTAGLLRQIADIQRMEPGKLCAMGKKGRGGPYYNLQCRENGKPVSRYVPQDQVEEVARNTENFRTFETLVDQYAQVVVEQTRAERLGGQKKRRTPSASGRTRNSGS